MSDGELLNEAHGFLRTAGRNDLADVVAINYGKIVSLRNEIDRLRAENARQRAWIDGVMAQGACYARQQGIEWMSGNAFRTTEVGAQTSTRTIPLITRPAPFEDK